VNREDRSRNAGQLDNITATCEPGEQAVGGGGGSENAGEVGLVESLPAFATATSPPSGWRATFEWETTRTAQISAYAVCESP
jgi:hypothetical protein